MTTTQTEIPPAWAHQVRALEFVRGKPGAMLAMDMGTGKDLHDDTPIPRESGWARMGDLRPGDRLFDEQGNICTVTAVYPQGVREVYDVSFDDGASIQAGGEHLWMTLTHSHRARIHQGRMAPGSWASSLIPITTREIAESLEYRLGDTQGAMHSIPLAGPLDLPQAELPVDPYLLGAWLGEGSSAAPAATCHREDEPHYREAALAAGEAWRTGETRGNTLTRTMARGEQPILRERLRRLEVLGNKHIPQAYLRASARQRAELMRGLMDADGSIDPRNGAAQFTSVNERLARGFLELALSMGRKATISQGEAKLDGRTISPGWNVQYTPTIMPVSLAREDIAHRQGPRLSRVGQRYIRTVTPAGTAPTTCITVDSPSGLFLAGRAMVPTHNTRVAIDLMNEIGARRTLILCPVSVADFVWPDQLALHSSRKQKVITLGSRAGTVRKKADTVARELELHATHRIPLVVVVNYESAWRKPLGDILRHFHWDLLIMDESHRIKTAAGKASLFASRMCDRSSYRLAMTGTPAPNNPTDVYAQYRALDKSVFGADHQEFKDRYTVSEELNVRNSERMRLMTGEKTRTVNRPIGYKNQDELNEKFHSIAFVVGADQVLELPDTTSTSVRVQLGSRARRVHQELADEFRSAVAEGKVTNATNALTRLLRMQQVTSGFAVTVNQETREEELLEIDTSKATALQDILQDLPSSEPVVVFARFIHDLEVVRRTAEKVARPCWEISGRAKQLDEWNRTGGVLAAQIQAGSVGVDMTRARYCIYYSLGYSLGDYLQSCARVHRPGQSREVHYIHLIAAGTVDQAVMGSLRKKEHVIEEILRVRDLTPRNQE